MANVDVNAAGRVRLGARQEKRTEARYYVQPRTGLEAPSHSTVLKVLPKPALDNWSRNNTIEWTVRNKFRWEDLPVEDAVNLVAAAKHNPQYDAAAVGDVAHLIFENSALGYEPYNDFPVPSGYECVLEFWDQMVEEYELSVYAVEPRVHNYEWGISGSPDLLVWMTLTQDLYDPKTEELVARKGERVLAVWDYKTGNGLYGSTAYQNMYTILADTWEDEEGVEHPMPQVRASFGVWVRPTGWALIPLSTGEDVQVVVKAARALYDRVDTTKYTWNESKYKGKAINANPVKSKGRPWPAIEDGRNRA